MGCRCPADAQVTRPAVERQSRSAGRAHPGLPLPTPRRPSLAQEGYLRGALRYRGVFGAAREVGGRGKARRRGPGGRKLVTATEPGFFLPVPATQDSLALPLPQCGNIGISRVSPTRDVSGRVAQSSGGHNTCHGSHDQTLVSPTTRRPSSPAWRAASVGRRGRSRALS